MKNQQSFLFTSESVGRGHPDKLCDQVSDAIVDLALKRDPQARVACECLATTNRLILAGELRVPSDLTRDVFENAARDVIRNIGYEQDGFHWKEVQIDVLLHKQSADIALGVDASSSKDEGAGDQGIMFGYASNETPSLMPAAIYYAHKILQLLDDKRSRGLIKGLGPDAKSQVTLLYENERPVRATSIVVSTQHNPELSQQQVREIVRPVVLEALPSKEWMCPESEFYVNPTGRFVIGGPVGDCGLTGRKIIVDTYGGAAPHGGGAFSGKDPTKVDRSAAYASRYVAKNVVAAGLADRCTIQLSYAIGVAKPLSVYANLHDTGKVREEDLCRVIPNIIDLSPRGIRERLGLNKPIYHRTAAYGHFGRDPEADGGFSWEKLDLVRDLKTALAA